MNASKQFQPSPDLRGKVGICGRGELGFILDTGVLPWGKAWVGVNVSSGKPWSSRAPENVRTPTTEELAFVVASLHHEHDNDLADAVVQHTGDDRSPEDDMIFTLKTVVDNIHAVSIVSLLPVLRAALARIRYFNTRSDHWHTCEQDGKIRKYPADACSMCMGRTTTSYDPVLVIEQLTRENAGLKGGTA